MYHFAKARTSLQHLNSIKEILGHANLSATQVYTHNSIEKLKKTFRQSHPRSGE
jgi:integrase/recombinase XerC